MKKKLFTIIGCATLACALLVGCKSGGNNNGDKATNVTPPSSSSPSNTEVVVDEVEYTQVFSTTFADIGDEAFSADRWWIDKDNTLCVYDETQSKAVILKIGNSKATDPLTVDLSSEVISDIIYHRGNIHILNTEESSIKTIGTDGSVISTKSIDLSSDDSDNNKGKLTPDQYTEIKFETFGDNLLLKLSSGSSSSTYYGINKSVRDGGYVRTSAPYAAVFINRNDSKFLTVTLNGEMHVFENSSQFDVIGVSSSAGVFVEDGATGRICRYNMSGELISYCNISNTHKPIDTENPYSMFNDSIYMLCRIENGFEIIKIPLSR